VRGADEEQQLRRKTTRANVQPSFPPPLLPPPRDIRINVTAAAATDGSDVQHVFGPVVFDHKRQRRLELGGYLVLFDETITDVERHALRLAKVLQKEAKEIMSKTIHAVYLKDLSEEDVAYIWTYPGVKEVEPNYQVSMFNLGGSASSSSTRRQDRRAASTSASASGDIFSTANTRDQVKARGQSVDDVGDSSSDSDGDSDGSDMFNAQQVQQQQLTEEQKKRNRLRRKQQMAGRPDKAANLQQVPWNIDRVNGPKAYKGTNKVFIIDTGIDLDNADLNVNLYLAKNFVNPGTSAQDDHGHGT
jgi:hypothetical protein